MNPSNTDVKRIGVLTGGGDCPGLNPVIRAVVRRAIRAGIEVMGIRDGWKGLVSDTIVPLDINSVSGILSRGGTILGTSRTNIYKNPADSVKAKETMAKHKLDALIAIGGEDTLGVAQRLYEEGIRVVGVPKTIDNDLSCTDYTFGFDSAINIAMEAIDRLHTTAESHNRVIVVELMGRHTGWIAMHAGIAGGADAILIPDVENDIDLVVAELKKRHARGKRFSIVAIAEGVKLKNTVVTQDARVDDFGHVRLGGVGQTLAAEIERRTGYETRTVVLGHLQRGGSPTAFDRILGTRFGIRAVELVLEGGFGKMVCLRGNTIETVEIKKAIAQPKTVDGEWVKIASVFYG
ncbi:MAG: 6-phosphofructokinase [Candidatus Omnitrophica bacterium]|nr:6-phosphofructokinase [Candidatus Omnitrophota bacterium]